MMQPAFPRLLRGAILGTQHGPPETASGDGALDALLAAGPDDAPERALLRAAGLFATIERVATIPAVLPDPQALPVDDLLPRCGPLAAHDLRAILAGETGETQRELLIEWLGLASRFGRRAPEESLPVLLARGAQSPELRDAVRRAADVRGWWLAAQNPRWSYAARERDDERTFEEVDSIGARAAALQALRALDPAAARARLAATWATEQPADRALLLPALRVGLTLDDEAFLETARADKRKEVRSAAASLLHRLPDSAAARRAIAAASPLVRVVREAGTLSLAADLPEAATPEMEREGVEVKSSWYPQGPRAWLLEQYLARVPPAHWRAGFSLGTGPLFDLARTTEFAVPVMRGFARAIQQYGDREGLGDLLALATEDPQYHAFFGSDDLEAMPSAERDAAIRAALREGRAEADTVLAMLRGPWSPALSRAALDFARGAFERPRDWTSRRTDLMRAIGLRIDVATPNVEHGWPHEYATERAPQKVAATLVTIAFRVGMFDHLAEGL